MQSVMHQCILKWQNMHKETKYIPLSIMHQTLVGSSSCSNIGLPSLSEYFSLSCVMYSIAPEDEGSSSETFLFGLSKMSDGKSCSIAAVLLLVHDALLMIRTVNRR